MRRSSRTRFLMPAMVLLGSLAIGSQPASSTALSRAIEVHAEPSEALDLDARRLLSLAQLPPSVPVQRPTVDTGVTKHTVTEAEKREFEEIQRWIAQTKPSKQQIEARMEAMRRAYGLPPSK